MDGEAVDILNLNRYIWGLDPDQISGPGSISNRGAVVRADGSIEGLSNPGNLITEAWPYLFAIAGLILFGMLLWGSMEVMFGAATPKSAESGKKRITNAIIGFVLLFCVFWIGQIIQQIFGLNFLGTASGTPTP